MQLRRVLGCWSRIDQRPLLWIVSNSRLAHVASQQWNLRCTEYALLQICIQLVVSHELNQLLQMLKMSLDSTEVFLRTTVDKNVIEVAWAIVSKRSQQLRLHRIESGWCSLQLL